ncbi:hypothetical protein ACFE04_012495 [Oxalis oulophora]
MGKMSEVEDNFNRKKELGCLPDEITYRILIDGYCKVGSDEEAFKLFIWCAKSAASLIVKSNKDPDSSGIKWAALNPGERDNNVVATRKRGGGPLSLKANAMSDVLRLSIYSIVSEFHTEISSSAKAELLEDWVLSNKPYFGTRELLVHKLHLFLDHQA